MEEICCHFKRKMERCLKKDRKVYGGVSLSHQGLWTLDNGEPVKDYNANLSYCNSEVK